MLDAAELDRAKSEIPKLGLSRGWRGNWDFVIVDLTTAIRRGKAQKWTCSSVSACALLVCCCLPAKADTNDSKTVDFEGLPDGTYLIERTLFSPPKMFYSKEAYDAYLEEFKKHPELENTESPQVAFFQLYVQQGSFVIHQVIRTNDTEYVPKGNFFVSVNGIQNWTYEERANTVTLITNSPNYSLSASGPVAGLLETGQSFYDELRTLGMESIGSPTITRKGLGVDVIAGQTQPGLAYNGQILYDNEGRATNIVCSVTDPSTPYDLGFDISYRGSERYATHVLHTRRNAGNDWRRVSEVMVLDISSSPAVLPLETFWAAFTNENTRVVLYDPETKTTSFLDRNSPPLANTMGSEPLVKTTGSESLTNAVGLGRGKRDVESRRKWAIVSVFVAVTVAFGSAVGIKLRKKDTRP